jgi:hypothetical protein
VIEVGIGQEHGLNARAAFFPSGETKRRETLYLPVNIRRSIQKKPITAIGADGNGGLGAGKNTFSTASRLPAHVTMTIPLRHSSACRCAQQMYLHRIKREAEFASKNTTLFRLVNHEDVRRISYIYTQQEHQPKRFGWTIANTVTLPSRAGNLTIQ